MILATGTICTPATWRGTDVLEDRRPRRGLYGGARGTGRDLTGTVTVCVGNQGELAEFSDLNVTIGGELTFVPADRESGETNTRVEHTPTENGTATATEVEVERHTRSVNRTTVDLTTVQQGTAVALGNVTLPVRERYRRVLLDVTVEGATLASGDGADVSAGNGAVGRQRDARGSRRVRGRPEHRAGTPHRPEYHAGERDVHAHGRLVGATDADWGIRSRVAVRDRVDH